MLFKSFKCIPIKMSCSENVVYIQKPNIPDICLNSGSNLYKRNNENYGFEFYKILLNTDVDKIPVNIFNQDIKETFHTVMNSVNFEVLLDLIREKVMTENKVYARFLGNREETIEYLNQIGAIALREEAEKEYQKTSTPINRKDLLKKVIDKYKNQPIISERTKGQFYIQEYNLKHNKKTQNIDDKQELKVVDPKQDEIVPKKNYWWRILGVIIIILIVIFTALQTPEEENHKAIKVKNQKSIAIEAIN